MHLPHQRRLELVGQSTILSLQRLYRPITEHLMASEDDCAALDLMRLKYLTMFKDEHFFAVSSADTCIVIKGIAQSKSYLD